VLRLAQTIGGAFSDRRAQAALRERIKELTCLYGISQVVRKPGISIKEILQDIVELLQKAFQYPEIAVARIFLDGRSYTSKESNYEGKKALKGDIIIGGEIKGFVEVAYLEDIYEIEDGPFLKEEKNLIDEVSRQVSLIVEGKKAEEDKLELQNQLRHADRLATTGQLAAGIAHELNEPLSNILGFAQLAKKNPIIQKQTVKDLEKIIEASLHAREVVKKLLVFTRQIPARKSRVNLNQIVADGLYILESRCRKEGIDLVRVLSPELPDITADPTQMNQVLINLVVNSIQAMPAGGKLTVRTTCKKNSVSLIVKDTGTGMSEEVVKQIFVPFFTTKEIGEGTGLGLAVVHGIVTSHGGAVKADSRIHHGTSFEVTLPLGNNKD
jgi:signal transduction histidine kinase